MEFLKSLFEKGALTWEQFQQAAKDAKFEVVNAAGGAYVPKADLDTKAQELTTANNTIKDLRETAKAWDGKDPKKLEDDLKDLQTKYDTDTANIRRDAAIHTSVTEHGEHDLTVRMEMEQVFAIEMAVVSHEQATMLERTFKNNAEAIYQKLLGVMTQEYPE